MIAAPPKPTVTVRRRDLLRSPGGSQPFATSLSTINRLPQGSPQIDSQTYPDECDPTHPFHFDFLLSTNILVVNRVLLSFFLRAFRRTLASVNTVTSGSSSAASSGSSSSGTTTNDAHHHHVAVGIYNPGVDPNLFVTAGGVAPWLRSTGSGSIPTDTDTGHTHDNPHTHQIPHTHNVSPTLVDGIWEGAVATGVTVLVNGVDRTVALGGGAGFTTNQTELALLIAWLNLGAWNTIDLTPTGLGRITGHLTVVSYIQSM
jgi:hypothetical protein